MSPITDGARHTVVRKSARPTRVVLCVLAFVLTAAGVRMAGAKRDGPTRRIVTATATVFQQLPPDNTGNHTQPEVGQIERRVLSDANLRRVLTEDDSAEGAGIAQLRHDLRVEVTETSEPGELRISIGLSGHDAELTRRIVNDLAEQYAADCRASMNLPAYEAYQRAHGALAASQQTLVEAKTRLAQFLGRHFDDHQALAESFLSPSLTHSANAPQNPSPPLRSAAAPAMSPAKSADAPRMIDNPEWTELEGEISELARRREDLLAHRTLLHPTVREIENQIAGLERRLATIPPRAAEPQSATPVFDPPPQKSPPLPPPVQTPSAQWPGPPPSRVVDGKAAVEHTAAVEEFWTLKKAAEQAASHYEQLAQVERHTWEQQCQTPAVRLQTAAGGQVEPVRGRSGRLLLVMLTSALAMAAGVGMICSGFGTERPLRTAAEVEAKLAVPVVGTIVTGGPSGSVRHGWQQPLGSLGLLLYGMVLVFLCFGILLMAFGPT